MKSPAATAALSSVRAANRSARNRARRAQHAGGGPHSHSSSPSSSRGGAIPGRPVDDAHDDRPPSAARILRAWRLAASAPNGVAAALGEGADPARALGSVLDALLVAGAVDDACDVLREALDANVRVPAAYLERVTRAWTKIGDDRGGGEGGEGDDAEKVGGGAVGREDGRGRRRLDASPTGGGVRTLETLVRAFEAFVDAAREPPTLRAYTDVIAALAKAESTGRELAFSASYRGRYATSYREEEEEEEEAEVAAEAEGEGEGSGSEPPASSASKTTTSQSPARLATALWRELRRSPSPALAPDAKAYTAAAMAFAALGDFESADGLIREMTRRRVPPDARLFNVLIAARGRAGDLAGVRAAEAQMRAFSVRPNAATHGARVAAYALGCDRVDLAARALDSGAADPDASRRPGVRAYTALAQGLARDRRPEEALAVLARMRREGVAPNAWSYTVVVDGFVKAGDVERAAEVIEEMRRRGVEPTAVTYNTLLNAPGTRRTSRAKTASKSSSEGSSSGRSGSSGKESSAKAGASDGSSSRKAAEETKRGGVSSSEDRSAAERRAALSSSSSSSSSSEEAAASERRRSTTSQTPPASPPPPASPQTPPASPPSSVPSSRLDSFRSVLDSMRLAGVDATAVTYNALIDACVSAGEPTEAMFALLSAMVDAGHRPDVVTYTTLLKHFGRDGDVVAARWLMREMQADETVAVDAASWNAFVDALARAGAFEEAAEVISREMTTTTYSAAGKGGKGGKAGVGVAPDRATYGALADGLARAGAFETLASLRDALMGRGAGEDGRGWTLSTYARSDGGGGGGAVATTTRDFPCPPARRSRTRGPRGGGGGVREGGGGGSLGSLGRGEGGDGAKVAEGVVADAAREGRDAEAAELKTLFRRERAKAAAARSRARRGRATLTRVTRGSRGASSSSPRRTRGFERSAAAAEKGGTGEGSEEKAAPSSEVAAAPSSEVAAAPSSEASDPSPPRPAAGPGGLEMWKHWLGLPSQYYAGEDAPPTVAEAKEYAASREASASSNSGASSGAKNPSDAASSDAPPPSPGNTTTPPRRYSREDIAEAVKLLRLAARSAAASKFPDDPEAALEAALRAAEEGDARRVEEAAGRMRREAEKSRRVDEAVRRLRSAAASKFPDDPEAALEAALRAAEEGDARGVVVEGRRRKGNSGRGRSGRRRERTRGDEARGEAPSAEYCL